jgi:hypothetical protein
LLARLPSQEEGVLASLCLFVYPSVHPFVSAQLTMDKPSWHLGALSTTVEKVQVKFNSKENAADTLQIHKYVSYFLQLNNSTENLQFLFH